MISPEEKRRILRVRNLHRRLGMVVVLFLLLLTGTGVLLNHSEDMGLAEQPVSGLIGSLIYDLDTVTGIEAWQVDGRWLYAMNHKLYLEGVQVDYCDGSLIGAVEFKQMLVALCSRELLIMDHSGQLIERVFVETSSPSGVTALAPSNDGLVLRVNNELRLFDLDKLESSPMPEGPDAIEWNTSRPLPDELLDQLQISVPELNMERLILDIHSGRILGDWRQLAMDLLAILILFLAIGGVVMMQLRKD